MDSIQDLLNPKDAPTDPPHRCPPCALVMEPRRRGAGWVWVCPNCTAWSPDSGLAVE